MITKEELLKCLLDNLSQREIADKLEKNRSTILYYLNKYNLKTENMKQKSEKVKCAGCDTYICKSKKITKYCSLKCQAWYYITKAVLEKTASARTLKVYLLKLDRKCNICSNNIWNNKDIPLELDHIDGNSNNNILENVRLLCPNCHAQTDTYKNKNKGKGRQKRRKRYLEGKSW